MESRICKHAAFALWIQRHEEKYICCTVCITVKHILFAVGWHRDAIPLLWITSALVNEYNTNGKNWNELIYYLEWIVASY